MHERKNQNTNVRELTEFFGTVFLPLGISLGLMAFGAYNIMSPDAVHNILFTRPAGVGELATGLVAAGATMYFDNRANRRAQDRRENTPTRR